MKRLTSVFIFVLLILFASSSLAQNLPLNQKQWYGLGVEGAPPDTSNYNGIVQQIASQTGLVDAAGNVCFAAADAGCRVIVALGGALGAVSLSLMNGADIPIGNIGLNVLSGNYFHDGTGFVGWFGEQMADGLALPVAPYVGSVMLGYNGATLDLVRIGSGASADAVLVTSATDDPAVIQLGNAPWDVFDDDAVANCVAITAGSVPFNLSTTMPGWSSGDWVCAGADGNMAYILCGAAPTATTVVGGFSWKVPSGTTKCRRLIGPVCAIIGMIAAGTLCFEHLDPDL